MNSTVHGWRSEPDGRGTASLLWSCIFTIFICTWSIIHIDVPHPDRGWLFVPLEKCFYLGVGLVAPEIMSVLAIDDFFDTRSTGVQWTFKQAWFLSMGGFLVEDLAGQLYPIETSLLVDAFRDGIIPIPRVTEAEINDKSKADGVVKALVSLQVIWFLAQLVARAAQHLPVTTLELFTTAIISRAAITYAFWWMKPQDVNKPVVIKLTTEPPPRYLQYIRDDSLMHGGDANHYNSTAGVFVCVCILFGTCHIVGWNFEFPSHTEQLLWRIASASCPTLPTLIFLIGEKLDEILPPGFDFPLVYSLTLIYLVIRLYLFVEIFLGLRAVPAGVYQSVNWTSCFPHI
ncbi:hypothetical protein BU16DRAFT_520362 [Lophium mytilinum]|uniref:Uncharacterized protein n=1 Tax=Lophium mytilinum TaxID=390894 RepID=A0A6A6Q965_9PEZI|nr:hypothetical protein BU16DRAFT_520362 [Lophium mytilinum]